MKSSVLRLDQIITKLITLNKCHLQSLLLNFFFHMPNILEQEVGDNLSICVLKTFLKVTSSGKFSCNASS